MKRRIVIVYDTIFPFQKGGAEKRLYEIATGLVRCGWEVTWYGLRWWGPEKTHELDGITLVGVGDDIMTLRDAGKSRRRAWSALQYCRDLLREEFPDDTVAILIGQTPWLHFFPVRCMSRARRIPVFVDCWEIWARYWIEYYGPVLGRIGAFVERWVLKHADGLIGISGMTCRLIEQAGGAASKVTLAHNGVNLADIQGAAISAQSCDIIYFGRLVPHKNVDVLLRAIAQIKQRQPQIKAHILGGGPELSKLQALSTELGLQEQVQFFGVIDTHTEAMSLLKAAKVFVQPSTSEGGGSIAVFEAHACGLPVVAVRHPQGIDPELINHGLNGYWVDELEPSQMAHGIEQMLINSTSSNTRKQIEASVAQFDWASIAKVYDDMFRSRQRTT